VPVLDVVIVFITRSYLFKGGVMMTFLWWGWFRPGPDQERKRLALMSVLFAALVTLLAARLLALTLPHRVRPMQDAAVDMVLPIGMAPMLQGWSSFPSDHAALFGCLASGMFLVSRRAGWLASAYCFFIILLPRVYTGLHFPSDILVGYGLGTFMTWSVSRRRPMERCIRPAFAWFMARPQVWYPLFFLVSYEIATLFDDVRNLGTLVYRIIDWMLENN